ncbi:hypothetical protein QBC32DRAFT_383379 [Pseudoneurospora amorphoporcata]|uniref:F-box domain-containing protein n=1 Tax=Pseudoneurospora amorphoporcata TaxID=241081 RepID=A0AAN6NLC1_9PEZI|nr:hypothetical protein QBC32DRAFT_383379 [Pseudoneurospora amorphoporcata]
MDTLPAELLRLIFDNCDPPSVRALRLTSGRLADVGYDYLLPPSFRAVEWKDDVQRLHSIAHHDRLNRSINSITFNFSKAEEFRTIRPDFFFPQEQSILPQYAGQALRGKSGDLPPFHTRSAMVEESFKRLPNLKDLEITYTKCPYDDIKVFKDVMLVRNPRKRDQTSRAQACKNMNAIISAVRHVSLSSLTIDQLPLEIFRLPDDRRHWFDCCASSFSSLSKLDLTIDPPANLMPQSRFKAINGLGHVLQLSPNLTHLSLSFHTYHSPASKFGFSFRALLQDFTFQKLTCLKLEGVSCSEEDLRSFLLRHAKTLERLRLGGRGLAKPYELSIGGVHLHEGSFKSLFASLQGKLPKLQRLHLEGDLEAGDIRTGARERETFKFHASVDENWEDVLDAAGDADMDGLYHHPTRRTVVQQPGKTMDSSALERYLIHGGPFPRLVVPGVTSTSTSVASSEAGSPSPSPSPELGPVSVSVSGGPGMAVGPATAIAV